MQGCCRSRGIFIEGAGISGSTLTDHIRNCSAQGSTVIVRQPTELADNQASLQRRDKRLDGRTLEQARRLPFLQPDLTESSRCAELAGYRHQDHIGSRRMIVCRTDNDSGTPLGCCLISEREGNQNYGAEGDTRLLKGHRRCRLRDYPRRRQKQECLLRLPSGQAHARY